MSSTATAPGAGTDLANNLRRLMAAGGWTIEDVVRMSGLDHRTVKGVLSGRKTPHARTLHRLASGLGVSVDEFFQNPALLAQRAFNRQTNPQVSQLMRSRPAMFNGWTAADFDELYSRFGTGGALTEEGVGAAVAAMNRKRDILTKVSLLLECGEADVLVGLVDLLYRRSVVAPGDGSGDLPAATAVALKLTDVLR